VRGCSGGVLTRLAGSGCSAVRSNPKGMILATGTLRFSCMTSHDEPEPWGGGGESEAFVTGNIETNIRPGRP
jgi:hypothetical protein